jgi:hypothetical protein
MKKVLVYIAVFAMALTLFAVPVFADEVPCPTGGSLEYCCPTFPCHGDPCTPGYWKNHAERWDDRTDLPLGYDPEEWLVILNTPSNEGPWYQLAKQYIAAWLNFKAGGVYYEDYVDENVTGALVDAESLLNVNEGDRGTLDRQRALELKDFLDIFNNYDRTE